MTPGPLDLGNESPGKERAGEGRKSEESEKPPPPGVLVGRRRNPKDTSDDQAFGIISKKR